MAGLIYMSLSVKSDENEIALVFPPNFSERQTLAAISNTEGAIVRFGGSSNIIITSFEGSNHYEILEKTGAIAIVNPRSTSACAITEVK